MCTGVLAHLTDHVFKVLASTVVPCPYLVGGETNEWVACDNTSGYYFHAQENTPYSVLDPAH
ncbi:hypothetical protein [Mycobacterium vicinigordonae]|uniref:Uncharacterized protein n=1 Tax=Mycobacterium vicinigordonae TaxID=1719132 RepID=A0A7D6DZ69_9MYCO|nr:hypothetical protein [Mycobacterium vicinigordonae]QLL06141.1 hypothetical protein H0P51_20525 [Mycobacterium vicinigordonae]